MPLFVGEKKIRRILIHDQLSLWKNYPELENASKKFKEQPVKIINNKDDGMRLLYIIQGEVATCHSLDTAINMMGSDEATTCHIVIFIDKDRGIISMAHFDECNIRSGIELMITEIKEIVEAKVGEVFRCDRMNVSVHIIGGFVDDRSLSWKVSVDILSALCDQSGKYDLQTLCTCDMNNAMLDAGINSPMFYGAGINTKSLEIFPATFSGAKSPDISLRHARLHSPTYASGMYSIYDTWRGQVVLRPFIYHVPLHYTLAYLRLDDEDLLLNYSTSPQVEPPGFVQQVRKTFEFIRQHPNPLVTIFKGNKDRRYEWEQETHEWKLITVAMAVTE